VRTPAAFSRQDMPKPNVIHILNDLRAEGELPDGGHKFFPVQDYDLDATLSSGQVFRWHRSGQNWEGVIGHRWVRLSGNPSGIVAQTAMPCSDWSWLSNYLQLHVPLSDVLRTLPQDEPIHAAVNACRGLRLLRQEPWECLASFILSSTKQILQIQQIVRLLCQRYGEPVLVPPASVEARSFPPPELIAKLTEAELRGCKMGFRAPYLLETARIVSDQFDLHRRLQTLKAEEARVELMQLPGVGRKIADCVLLFAYGFQTAFPVDVWVMKALRQLYFPRRTIKLKRLYQFTTEYFGPNAGYAQQYLFHYMRTVQRGYSKVPNPKVDAGR